MASAAWAHKMRTRRERDRAQESRREAGALRSRSYASLGRRLGWDDFVRAVRRFTPIP